MLTAIFELSISINLDKPPVLYFVIIYNDLKARLRISYLFFHGIFFRQCFPWYLLLDFPWAEQRKNDISSYDRQRNY
jgi:hypothetical protein